MNISIFGLGYVGCVSAACLASLGHKVIGVDIKPRKVELINSGTPPLVEPQLDDLLKEGQKNGLLFATTSSEEAIMKTDVSFISVGTPSQHDGKADLTYIKRVVKDIAIQLKKKDFHIVVIRSTVFPGTIEDIIIPHMEENSGKNCGRDFDVISNPEFLREGSAIEDFFSPPFTLLGGNHAKNLAKLNEIYSSINAPIFTTEIKVAEMIKYANNSFHALKVAFGNEIGNICKEYEIDSHKVMDIFCKDTKLNLSPYYLKPGFAFGGSCLPKDLAELISRAEEKDVRIPLLDSIFQSNETQIERGIKLIENLGRKKIGILGLSFKPGTDDLRNSPIVALFDDLLDKGYGVRIFDENVYLSKVSGRNKEAIEKDFSEISSCLTDDMSELLENSEVIIIGVKNPEFREAIESCTKDQIVVDLVGLGEEHQAIKARYIGINW